MRPIYAFAAGIAATIAVLAVMSAKEIGAEEGTQEQAQEEQSGSSDRYSELVKVDGAYQETFVLPGVNFGDFNKVFLWQAQFEYRDVGPARKTRSTMLHTHKREFGISEEDRQKFEEIVGEAFEKEISKAKEFTIVENIDDIDAATLILRGALIDIISKVPPEMVGRSDVYLSSVGAATFVMEFIDARTGSVVALVAERRAIETMNSRTGMATVPANSASVMGDIRRWSGDLARRLRSRLDKAIAEGKTA
jgi:hypothetical protein